MPERLLSWVERHASVLSVFVVGSIAMAAVIGVTLEQSRSKAVDREQLEQLCETVTANQQAMIGLIEVVLDDPSEEVPPLLRARLEAYQVEVSVVPQPEGCHLAD